MAERNPYHKPAGTSEGGQFTTGPGSDKFMSAVREGAGLSQQDTMTQFCDEKGVWTAERQALHEEIKAKFFKGKTPVENPQSFLTGGGPAAGKTTLLQSDKITIPENHVLASGDEIKKLIPEYTGDNAFWVHEESSYLSKVIAAEASNKGYNVVMDSTGDSGIRSLTAKVKLLSGKEQPVHGIYISVDTDIAVARSIARAKETGRYMPESILRATHVHVSQDFPEAVEAGIFATTKLYDTSGESAKLIASGLGSNLDVLDEKLYREF